MLRPFILVVICQSVVAATERDDVVMHPEAQPDGSSPEWRPVDYDTDGLLQLTSANFSSARAAHNLLVAFHAPWCSHCKAFLPEFASAADRLLERGRADLLRAQGLPDRGQRIWCARPASCIFRTGAASDAR